MHGLVNRALQVFVRDTHGEDAWTTLIRAMDLGFDSFESMLSYEDEITFRLIDTACHQLCRDRRDFLEDLGTYLISHDNVGAVRRLMRFGGDSFLDFLFSLDELNDRARLAVPELTLPAIEVTKTDPTDYQVMVGPGLEGFSNVLVGVLRAMADDYGALVLLDYANQQGAAKVILVTVLELQFSEGRDFVLGAQP